MMLSDVYLPVAYIGPKSRTERLRKTKIGTEVAHVTCDSDTTFRVKRLKVKVTRGGGTLWRHPAYSLLYIIIDSKITKILPRAWLKVPTGQRDC